MKRTVGVIAVIVVLGALAQPAAAQNTVTVHITNISKQIISPPVVTSHSWMVRVFNPGKAASDELAALAEDGDFSGLVTALEANENVLDVAVGDGLLMPGQTVSLDLAVTGFYDRISAVGMLVTSNDAFFGLESLSFRGSPTSVVRTTAPAYDAGTEFNSESCAFIPGPPCGSPGVRDIDGAEGFIHIHPGLHGSADLSPAEWDWQNPVVRISVAR
jgi:hypothetical protein